jgi:hypothetical protein
MAGNACDVCGTEEDIVGVASSGLGPISFCFCKKCIIQNAEPISMFEATLEIVGKEVAEHVTLCRTFKDGKYISWNQFVEEHDSCK